MGWTQNSGTQRRRERNGGNDRKRHGRNDGDGELAVNDACRATEERHGQENH